MENFVTEVTFVHQDNYTLLTEKLHHAGMEIVVLDGRSIRDASSLWEEMVKVLPFPMNEHYSINHWELFADHIRFGLLAKDTPPCKALLWTHVENILAENIQDLCDAIIVLSRIYYSTATNINFDEIHTYLYTFLIGDGPHFPHVIAAETRLRFPYCP